MTTTTSHPSPSRFSRVGLNLGLKSQSELRYRASNTGRGQYDEDWYIPYTGTYEPPPEPRPSRNRDRDSWGDLIPGLNGVESAGIGPHVHYDDDSSDGHDFRSSEESRVRTRGRAQSISSNYTASTGIDHGRASQGAKRQYHTTSAHRLPTPSYVNLGIGGVGESPVPPFPRSKERTLSHRGSLASIFTFGIKSPSSVVAADHIVKSPSRRRSSRPSTSSGADRASNRLSSTDHRRTTSGDSSSHSIRVKRGVISPLQIVDSRTTTEEDYYHSYYSTLLQSPAKPQPSMPADPLSSSDSPPAPSSQHPYAIAFPDTEGHNPARRVPPNSAPPIPRTYQPPLVVPKLTFSLSNSSTHLPGTASAPPAPSPQRQIKASVSTPNLKTTRSASSTSRNVPKGIDRWLSAETWCDALLFPRPRLKIKNEKYSSGRIVSPPGSPVLHTGSRDQQQTISVPSRVLAHSMSLVNLREGIREEPRQQQSQGGASWSSPPTAKLQSEDVNDKGGWTGVSYTARPPRPKSWASDDLDLPSPVPSLAKVLAEGERLESDRKEWRSKAEGSWGYKRARNVSRSRSKSLTANGRKKSSEGQSNVDFLTARAVHGNQDIIPVLPSTPKHKRTISSSQGTNSHSRNTSNSHTQTSSLIRSWTQSSKSPPRGHSRNGSWSNSAIKAVKSSAPCCNNDATSTPIVEKNTQLHHIPQESVLPRSEAQTTRLLPDPTPVPLPLALPPPIGPSPTPSSTSGVSDPRVGIAISTPLTDESLDREHLRLASHPYAQGGLYSYTPPSPVREKRAEYAGPHPVQNVQPHEIPEGPAARHRLPPQVTLSHPYARILSPSRDSYDDRLIQHSRPDSDVPPPAKMWAPLAPGVVREILPDDLSYSPFIAPNANLRGDVAMAMAMTGIVDTVGVGEALAYADECQEQEQGVESVRDSGLGTSENIHPCGSASNIALAEAVDEQETIARLCSPSRLPVQYDVTRPSYRPQRNMPWTPETLHTLASSPLEHQFTPRMPEFIQAEMAALASSALNNSENSSQRDSPRPLGSPNDLVGFQDLFYKSESTMKQEPSRMPSFGEHSSNGSQTRLSSIPFDLKSHHQRPTSSLASLARKLSQEYERISNKEHPESQYSRSSGSVTTGYSRPSATRRPTDASLEFVFEQPSQGSFTDEHGQAGSLLPFEPQENVPEDVNSRSSMETGKELEASESEDETEVFHVKQVETATPAEIDAGHRTSYAGQLGYHTERPEADSPQNVPPMPLDALPIDQDLEGHLSISSPTSSTRIASGLLAPLSDNARSSSYTTSTMSRMSGLSDFPVPPASHRMSLLSAFFNEVTGRPSFSKEDGLSEPIPSQTFNSNNRLTFGDGANAEEIVEALSNHPSHL